MSQPLLPLTQTTQNAAALVCFGPAGCGPSFYRRWAKSFDSPTRLMAVQLPGREGRHREARVTDFASLVQQLADALHPQLAGQYSFFGHSLGAALAFAVAQALEQRYGQKAAKVVVSARTVPDETRLTDLDPDCPTPQLLDFLVSLGCLPPALAVDQEAMDLYLPIIRDDLRLNIDAQYHGFAPIDADLVALAGTRDALATPAQMRRWQDYSRGGFEQYDCQGGHFFLLEDERGTVDLLRRIVDGQRAAPRLPTEQEA